MTDGDSVIDLLSRLAVDFLQNALIYLDATEFERILCMDICRW